MACLASVRRESSLGSSGALFRDTLPVERITRTVPSPFHVHLVAPSNEDSTYIKPLWASTLAAHTPEDVELSFRDDGIDPIDLEREGDAPDLVGISVNSKTAARAYAIADAYRATAAASSCARGNPRHRPAGRSRRSRRRGGERRGRRDPAGRGARRPAGRLGFCTRALSSAGRSTSTTTTNRWSAFRSPGAISSSRSVTFPSTSSRPREAVRSPASSAAFRPTTAPSSASVSCSRSSPSSRRAARASSSATTT